MVHKQIFQRYEGQTDKMPLKIANIVCSRCSMNQIIQFEICLVFFNSIQFIQCTRYNINNNLVTKSKYIQIK